MRYVGAGFLLYAGGRLIVQTLSATRPPRSSPPAFSSRRAFVEGFTISLLNPNVIVFMLALLPQFVDPSRGAVGTQLIALGIVQKCTGLLVLGGTALAAGKAGDWIAQHPLWMKWQSRCAGLVMMVLGLRLLVARIGRNGHWRWH
jgi:threonine/homoserine/homoserine lactone efflux protein